MTWQTRTSLYSHQSAAVQKVGRSRVGALFMEMGTGKTVSAIYLACLRQSVIDHVVYFCPVSLKETIRQEILKHTDLPESCVYVFNDRTTSRNVPRAVWYIVGIESISSSNRVVLAANALVTPLTMVVVDESDKIKTHRTIRTQRITAMCERAQYRLIMTGTPITQGVVDLYAQMRFLSPKILGYSSFYSFAANHLEYSENYPGLIVRAHNVDWLAAKIQPYTYQVTKEECLDLPAKLFDARYYRMTKAQREMYERAKWEMLMQLPLDEIDSYVIFQLFTALQQIVSGFWNRKDEDGNVTRLEFPHERLDTLQEAVERIPEGEKVIIWCKYHYSLNAIVERLAAAYGPDAIAQFHGNLNERQRTQQVERFRREAKFMVAIQQSGGRGLTLNESAYVIFYENEFNYGNRLQAEDRNHRIGQTRKVTYTDLLCADSIDTRIAAAQSKKGDVVRAFKQKVDKVKSDKKLLKKMIQEL